MKIDFSSSNIETGTTLSTCYFEDPVDSNIKVNYQNCNCQNLICSITISNSFSQGSLFNLFFGPVKNPPSVSSQAIKININYQPSGFSEKNENINSFLPGTFTVFQLSQSDFTVSNSNTYTFTLNPQHNIPNGGKLKVKFPAEVNLEANPAVVVSIYGSSENSASYSISDKTFTFPSLFPSGLTIDSSKTIILKISNVLNPSTVIKSSTFQIFTEDSSGNTIDQVNSGLFGESKTPGQIKILSVSPGIKTISATTTFLFTFKPQFLFGIGGKLKISFPNEFSIDSNSFKCNVILGLARSTGTTDVCTFTGNAIESQNLYYADLSSQAMILLSGIINPLSTKPTANLKFETYDDKGNLICRNAEAYVFSAVAGQLLEVKALRDSSEVNLQTKINLEFKIASDFEFESEFEIKVPVHQAIIKADPTCRKLLPLPISTITCTKISNTTSLSIIKTPQFCSSLNNKCTKGTILKFEIATGYSNPPYIVSSPNSIEIRILRNDAQGMYDEKNSGITISPNLNPSNISVTISKSGSEFVSDDSIYTFTFGSNDYWKSVNGRVWVKFPDNAIVVSNLKCEDTISSTILACREVTSASKLSHIEIDNICNVCTNNQFTIKISGVQNPSFETTFLTNSASSYFSIDLLTLDRNSISFGRYIGNNVIQIKAKEIVSKSLTISDLKNGAITSYTFKVGITVDIPGKGDGGILKVKLPSELTIQTDTTCSSSVSNSPLVCTISISTSEALIENNTGFKGEITIVMEKIKNPKSLKPVPGLEIVSYKSLNRIQFCSLTIQTTKPSSLTVSISRSESQVNLPLTLSISITISNEILKDGILKMEIPLDQIIFVNVNEIKFTLKTPSSLVIAHSIVSNSGTVIKANIPLSFCPCSENSKFSFEITGGKNPSSTKPVSSSFSFQTFTPSPEFLIDEMTNGLQALPAIGAGPLEVSCEISNRVAGNLATLSCNLKPSSSLSSVLLKITFPDSLFFQASGLSCTEKGQSSTCSVITRNGQFGGYAYTLSFDKICLSTCQPNLIFKIEAINLKNGPIPISQSSEIIFEAIDSEGGVVNNGKFNIAPISVNSPNTIKTFTAIRENAIVSSISFAEFEIETLNIIPKSSNFIVEIPKSQLIQVDSTKIPKCFPYNGNTLSSTEINCVFSNTNTLFKLTFGEFCAGENNFCPTNTKTKIRITEIKNPFGVSSTIEKAKASLKNGNFEIEKGESFISPELQPSNFKALSFSLSPFTISQSSILSIKFTLSSSLPTTSYFLFSSLTALMIKSLEKCFIIRSNSKSSIPCTISTQQSGNYITNVKFIDPCKVTACLVDEVFLLEVQGTNKPFVEPHSGVLRLEAYENSNILVSRSDANMNSLSNLAPCDIRPNHFIVSRSSTSPSSNSQIIFKLTTPCPIEFGAKINFDIGKEEILLQNLNIQCIINLPTDNSNIQCSFSEDSNLYKLSITQNFCNEFCASDKIIELKFDVKNPASQNGIANNLRQGISIKALTSTLKLILNTPSKINIFPLLQFGKINSFQISRNKFIVGETGDIQIKFTSVQSIDSNAKLLILFPFSYIYKSSASKVLLDSNEKSTIYTEENDSYGQKFISSIEISAVCPCDANKEITLILSSFINPKFIPDFTNQEALLRFHNGVIIAQESVKIQNSLKEIISTVELTRSSNIPNAQTIMNIKVVTSITLHTDSILKLEIPKVQIEAAKEFPSLFEGDTFIQSSWQSTTSFSTLIMKGNSNNIVYSLKEMKNPSLIFLKNSTNSAKFTLTTSKNERISSVTNIFVSPDLKIISLANLKISRSNNQASAQSIYSISFTLDSTEINAKARIKLNLPPKMVYKPTTEQCRVVTEIIVEANCVYKLTSGYVSEVQVYPICPCTIGKTYTVTFTGLNPWSIAPITHIEMMIKITDLEEKVDIGQGSINSNTLPGFTTGVISADIISSNYKVSSENVEISLKTFLPSGLRIGGKLEIIIPNELLTPLPSSCLVSSINCVVSNNKVSVTHSKNEIIQNLTISIKGFRNPGSNKPTSSFVISSFSVENGVTYASDKIDSGIQYIAKELGNITNVAINRANSILGSSSGFTFEFSIIHQIPANGKIEIYISTSFQADFSGKTLNCQVNSVNANCASVANVKIQIEACISQCVAGLKFKIEILSGLSNPYFTIDNFLKNQTFIINTITSEGYSIDSASENLIALPKLVQGSINIIALNLSNLTVNAESIMEIKFQSGVIMKSSMNKLIISFENLNFHLSNYNEKLVQMKENNEIVNLNKVFILTKTGIVSEIHALNICTNQCSVTKDLVIIIKGLVNPYSTIISNPKLKMVIQAPDKDSKYQNSSKGDYSTFPNLIITTLLAQEINTKGFIKGDKGQIEIIFSSFSVIPKNSKMKISFAEGFMLENLNCTGLYGFGKNLFNCSISNNREIFLDDGFDYDIESSSFGILVSQVIFPNNSSNYSLNLSIFNNSQGIFHIIVPSSHSSNCQNECEKCSNEKCFKCKFPSNFPFSLKNGTCANFCDEGKYFDISASQCYFCHSSCKSCYGPKYSNCLSCEANNVISNGVCSNVCVLNTTKIQNENKCQKKICNENCLTCSNLNSSCMSCKSDFALDIITKKCLLGSESCSDGYFKNASNCQKCSEKCLKCKNLSENCIQCSFSFGKPFINTRVCVSNCSNSTYANSDRTCINCNSACKECNGPNSDNCTECINGKYLRYGNCVDKCENNDKIVNGSICLMNCTNNCWKCLENNSGNCTMCQGTHSILYNFSCLSSCPESTYLSSNTCKLCNDNCLNCSISPDNCSACSTNPSKQFLSNFKCVNACPDGQNPDYLDKKKCKTMKCNSPCKNCGGGDNQCYSCNENYPYLFNRSCHVSCPKASYSRNESKNCTSCSISCEKCADNTTCLLCESGYYLYREKCISNCPKGYEGINRICEEKSKFLEWPSIFLLILTFIVISTVICSFLIFKNTSLNYSVSPLFSVIEAISKLLITAFAWNEKFPFLASLCFMVFAGNFAMGVMMKTLYFSLCEESSSLIRESLKKKPSRIIYLIMTIGLFFTGPIFARIMKSRLFGANDELSIEFFKNNLFRKNFSKSIFIYLANQGIVIAIDLFCLIYFNHQKQLFHLAYLNLFFNLVIVVMLIMEFSKLKKKIN